MHQAGLRNLLIELEGRVSRLERTYERSDHIAIPPVAVKAEVSRYLSKVDSLRVLLFHSCCKPPADERICIFTISKVVEAFQFFGKWMHLHCYQGEETRILR